MKFVPALLACLAATGAFAPARGGIPGKYFEGIPFRMAPIREVQIPPGTTSIAAYGAKGDGATMNTRAIERAIRVCAAKGGGTVDVPPGIWLTGPFRLLSNVRLNVRKGGVLLFSSRLEDYPLVAGPDGKGKGFRCIPCISGERLENIAITGGGSLDGQGEFWRPVKKGKMTPGAWEALVSSGGALDEGGDTWFPSKGAMEGEEYLRSLAGKDTATREEYARAREFLRPVLVQFVDCRKVLIDGPVFTNSPSFHIQPVECEDVVIRNVTVTAEWYAQNADGIDVSSCRRVVIYNCVVNAGDDAICLKPGRISPRQAPGPACEYIVIADCVVFHGHGGFVIGSQTYGGARNIAVRNCAFHGTDAGLRFKSAKGKGGLVENVLVDGITMTEIGGEAILFDMLYASGPGTAAPAGVPGGSEWEHLPEFRNVLIRNVVCAGAETAVKILGLASHPLGGITLEDVSITSDAGFTCADAAGLTLRAVDIRARRGPLMAFTRSSGVTIRQAGIPGGARPFLRVDESGPGAITIEGTGGPHPEGAVEFGSGSAPGTVVWR